MKLTSIVCIVACMALNTANPVFAADICQNFGPQSPRDITSSTGTNSQNFPLAPPSTDLNLCNLHTHTNAEHKGPGFSVSAGKGDFGGFKCNGSDQLTAAELDAPSDSKGASIGIKPGHTIEVHWVFSSCQVAPGAGLGACLSKSCANPTLRVES